MSKTHLALFKEKYNVSDYFVSVVESLLNKLIEFGYVSNSKVSYLLDILMENIDELRIGNKNPYDYKSGYYDSNKKQLYIKDEKNIPAVYLRLLYALTTIEKDDSDFITGYSNTKLRKDSYRLSYTNFGINRAIMANLVYKLCNLIPNSLQLTPTTKTHTHDFLGFKINSNNDLYSLEGKLLAELCYVLDLDAELLYTGLFSKNPVKYLDNIFSRKKFDNKEKFLKLFDDISKKYNTYNKLAYLSSKLNENYLDYKKHILNDNIDYILKDKEIIESNIYSVISSLYNKDNQDLEELEVTLSLSETLEKLEFDIKNLLIKFQDILCDNIIKFNSTLPYIKYASKLKCFNDILIVPNKKITKAIQDTILFKLMPEDEVTGINLIQKIKYAIIEQILSNQDYTNISNSFSFYNITNLEKSYVGSNVIILTSGKNFAKLVEVKGLNKKLQENIEYELNYIPLDNLKYIMTSNYNTTYIDNVEKLFTDLKYNFSELSKFSIDDIFIFEYDSKKYIFTHYNNTIFVISYSLSSIGYTFNKLTISEQYKVFGKTILKNTIGNSNLPMLYNKK